MTDNDLLARLDKAHHSLNVDESIRKLAGEAEAALRARDTELAAARAVERRRQEGWHPWPDGTTLHASPVWTKRDPGVPLPLRATTEPMSDAERAWLASVSPAVSGEDE